MASHDISSAKLSSMCDITYLSDDLLAKIFSLVPFRSTVGCKCVSKRWLDLISSPYFIKQFTSHQHSLYKSIFIFVTPHEVLLAFHDQNPSIEMPITFGLDMLIKGSLCGCSNNLFLCCKNRYTYGIDYYVYDPLLKKCVPIPPSPSTCNESLFAVGFVCKPTGTVITPECPNERNFRVVIIKSFIKRLFEMELYVFSSETGSWKRVVMNIPDGFAFAPHWLLSFSYGGSLYFMGRTSIFVFDPYTNTRDTLNYPLEADSMNIMSFGFLGISCGCLRIADIGQNNLRVWELVEKNHWDLLHSIDISKKMSHKFCANYYKKVAGFHPYDGDIVYLHSYADGVFICNLRTDTFEVVPGYEKIDISPFQLEIADLLLPTESSSPSAE